MGILRANHKAEIYLVICCLLGAFLCFAQVLGNVFVIGAVLMLFLCLLCLTAWKGMGISVLLFFLPWAPLLKFTVNSMSFFTIGIVLTCLVYLVKAKLHLNKKALIFALMLASITLLSKFIDGYFFDLSYVLFVFLLVMFPTIVKCTENGESFHCLTLFFSCGIILAALTAKELVIYPNIARYIDVYSWKLITRLSGYYGDPNFYSAHISAAIAALLLLTLKKEKKQRNIIYIALIIALIYCGFLAASKSFVIIISIMFILWFGKVLLMKNRISFKMVVSIVAVLAIAFVALSGLLSDAIEIIQFRFDQASDLDSLTTGRTEKWSLYINTIINDLKIFLLGTGFTNVKLEGVGSHNTVLQMIFQFGVIGSAILIGWFTVSYDLSKVAFDLKKNGKLCVAILLIGTILPWMAIDMLFFDEFFLIPLYLTMGLGDREKIRANE